jgi:hypothetical protein
MIDEFKRFWETYSLHLHGVNMGFSRSLSSGLWRSVVLYKGTNIPVKIVAFILRWWRQRVLLKYSTKLHGVTSRTTVNLHNKNHNRYENISYVHYQPNTAYFIRCYMNSYTNEISELQNQRYVYVTHNTTIRSNILQRFFLFRFSSVPFVCEVCIMIFWFMT